MSARTSLRLAVRPLSRAPAIGTSARPSPSLARSTVPKLGQRSFTASSSSAAPGSGPGSNAKWKTFAGSAATGFVIAFSIDMYKGYKEANQSTVQCDGAPAVEAIETYGYPWAPVDAIEKDDPKNPMRIRMANWVKSLQDHIVNTMEDIEARSSPNSFSPSPEPPKFLRDTWIRPEGGEGSSCVLSGGRVFEKAGINVSVVHGMLPPRAQKAMLPDHPSLPEPTGTVPFFATGLSIVIHPRNPHVPTVHLNYRYFEIDDPETGKPKAWWFGGGSDLTPSYLVEEDVVHFHKVLKEACDKHDERYWPDFKKACDKYFFLPHRGESRGVGGLFFDDLTTSSPINQPPVSTMPHKTQEDIFEFVKSASSAFLPAYVPIVYKNKERKWTEEERRWQQIRRGRYVEFNLVYDRGTKFGLNTPGARIESILMSLPETARWEYMCPIGAAGSNTPEEELVQVLRNPKEWV
ncbi:coproporphyrinogen III oxidase [Kwoniella heveanensis CBS 569]|nr:coproporphyrinogen III oxidase [Kwoniella heveanensis CBS 569]